MRAAVPALLVASSALLATGCGWPSATQPATRADLLEALIAVEQTYADNPLDNDGRRATQQRFDNATLDFFLQQLSPAARELRRLAIELQTGRKDGAAGPTTALLRVRVAPATWRPGAGAVTLTAALLPSVDPPADFDVTLRAVHADNPDEVAFERTLRVGAGRLREATLNVAAAAPPGVYLIEARGPDWARLTVARWRISTQDLDALRTANATRLAALDFANERLAKAHTIAASRNGLLQNAPAAETSAAYLANPDALATAVTAEIAALEAGDNPYRERTGEYWRVVAGAEPPLPLRLYVPTSAVVQPKAPLLIALHGFGGDEQLFFEGYGAGRCVALAERYGFILAAPRTEPLLTEPDLLAALLDELADDYDFDRSRVYLLGHSLGATAAVELARVADVAAVALFAGGQNIADATALPPTRLYAGRVDPIAQLVLLRQAVATARDRGVSIDLHVDDHAGHTLLVADQLDDAVAWLTTQ